MAPDKKTGSKWARLFPGLLLTAFFCTVALVSAWKLADYLIDEHKGLDYWEDLRDAVVIMETKPPVEPGPSPDRPEQPMETPETEKPWENPSVPAAIDFGVLRKRNKDVVAWIFAPGTVINYAVAQAGDNDYYLRRLLNGKRATCGTIFADCRCSAGFTDWNTIVYGHKMRNGTMFGELVNYQDQAYYEEHPVMFLYVPGQRYMLELIAGYTAEVSDPVYLIPGSREERDNLLARAVARSTFLSGVTAGEDDRLVTLSTCSNSSDTARYVVIGRLVEC